MRAMLAGLTICCLFLPLAACGGGGGGDGGDEGQEEPLVAPELLGPVHYSEMKVRPQGDMLTEAGPAQVDADGVLTGETAFYRLFPAPPEPLSPTRLDVDGVDGELTQFDAGDNRVRAGGIAAGNHLAVLAAGDNFPNMVVLTRPSTGVSNGTLDARYHFTLFSPSDGHSIWGEVDLDGRGGGSFPTQPEANLDGVLGDPGIESVTYDTRSDGSLLLRVRLAGGPDLEFEGAVANGGGLFTATRTDGNDEQKPMVIAAVRSARNASNGTLVGPYWFVGFFAQSQDEVMRFTTLRGVLVADGRGGCVVNATSHRDDGSFRTLSNEVATSSVDSDGTIELVFQDADLAMTGGIDGQGRHAVLGGSQVESFIRGFLLLGRHFEGN